MDIYLLIVNGAVVNTGVHVSFQVRLSSRYTSRSGIAESYGNPTFIL